MERSKNPFEAGTQKVIPAVLVYLFYQEKVLMIHRISKTTARVDFHKGKWNGLGGKCELNESPLEAANREVKEESGMSLDNDQLKPIGVILFPNFKHHENEDWIVFLFYAELTLPQHKGALLGICEEGELHWIPTHQILGLNLWPGDHHFLPKVLEKRPFMATICYEESQVVSHWIEEMGKN